MAFHFGIWVATAPGQVYYFAQGCEGSLGYCKERIVAGRSEGSLVTKLLLYFSRNSDRQRPGTGFPLSQFGLRPRAAVLRSAVQRLFHAMCRL